MYYDDINWVISYLKPNYLVEDGRIGHSLIHRQAVTEESSPILYS